MPVGLLQFSENSYRLIIVFSVANSHSYIQSCTHNTALLALIFFRVTAICLLTCNYQQVALSTWYVT